jgi:hypothetical protein
VLERIQVAGFLVAGRTRRFACRSALVLKKAKSRPASRAKALPPNGAPPSAMSTPLGQSMANVINPPNKAAAANKIMGCLNVEF